MSLSKLLPPQFQ
ncbi:hypothetical protein LINPERPRIM_LOCUS33670 [Linum perenne]